MKKLTIWAGRNPKKTVFIIILLQLLLVLSGVFLGTMVFESGIVLNKNLVYLVIVISSVGLILSPLKRDLFKVFYFEKTYRKQRFSNILLAISFLFGAVLLGNQYQTGSLNIYSPIVNANATTYNLHSVYSSVKTLKINKKNKVQKNNYKKYLFGAILKKDNQKRQKSGNFWSIVSIVLIAIVLVILLAALTCLTAVYIPGTIGVVLAISVAAAGLTGIAFLILSKVKKMKIKNAKLPDE